ncbi:MAG: DUF92 domain-containing protein [Candidatus Promineifilaceae bacterium]
MPQEMLLAFAISLAIVVVAFWRGSLSTSGAIGALVVGTLIFGFGGWEWGILLGVFFVSSSLLSHFREEDKRIAAEKFDKGHRRDIGQVFANGGLGSVIAVLSYLTLWAGWFPMFVGVMATVTADTWATELGTLAKRPPRLITTGQQVEVGSSGGVSPMGTAASATGGLIVGLLAGLLVPGLSTTGATLMGTLGGLAGSVIDSLLGATIQQIYYCDNCQKDTERKVHKCGHDTRPLRGWSWLNNDLVNLLASAAGGIVALVIWQMLL